MAEGHCLALLACPCGAGHNFVKIVLLGFGMINIASARASLLTLRMVEGFASPVILNRKTVTFYRYRCYEG